jgi:hypothetical protein
VRPRPFIGSPWNVSVVRFTGDAHGQSVKKLSRNAAVGVIKQHYATPFCGCASFHSRYKNLISYAWHEVAQKVRKHQIIVPDNQILIAQLTSRRVKYAQDGRLWLENKQEMRERGVGSPDLADAFVMAFAMQPIRAYPWAAVTNNWAEISKKNGWQYSDDSNEEYDDCYADRRTWNRQPADDSVTGFGGVHSIW